MGFPRSNTRLKMHQRCLLVAMFLALSLMHVLVGAQEMPLVTGRGNGFLQIRVPESTIYDAAIAESTLTTALQDVFPTVLVRCIEMKEADDIAAAIAIVPGGGNAGYDASSTFVLLFLIGDNIVTLPGTETLTVDLTQLRTYLQFRLGTTPPISILSLNRADATALGSLAALSDVATPTASSGFLRVNMNYRNLLTPANLTRSLVYQTRRGIARFLGLPTLSSVIAAGPPQVPPSTVLLVTQAFYVILPSTASSTMEQRERLANLLMYGDPSRMVATNDALSTRPSMFLDYVTAVSPSSPFLDPTVLLTLPFVFSSMTVEQLPAWNPPVPSPEPPVGTFIPATPTSDLLSRMRKTQGFVYPTTAPNRNDLPSGLLYLTPTERLDVSGTTSKCGTIGAGFCTHIVWNNTLDTAFWVESLSSVERVAWNLYPTTPLCTPTSSNTTIMPVSPPLGPSAIVGVGSGGDTPIWTFGSLSGASNRMDFSLQLRSLDFNETALTVEISTDMRSAVEAASTVTSIARRIKAPASGTIEPIYNTKSNVVVTYRSHFRNANEMFLFLTIRPSEVTKKDDSQPCAHCQNVYEWCQAQVKCAALMSCVLRDGIERAQVAATLLQSPTLQEIVDVSSYFRTCLSTPPTDPTDIDALLLFSSAVRCQLQRMCAFRTPSSYNLVTTGGEGVAALDLTNRILLWESGEGKQVIQGPGGSMPTTAATAWNVTMKLGSKVLCTLPIFSGTTAQELEDSTARLCRFANYLGRVSVTMALNTATTPSLDQVEFRFRYLVGPMPTLEVTPRTTGTTPTVVVSALPALRLRLETIDFATNLPAVPPSPPVDVCQSTCRRLALDVCLRDLSCVAFTDCIARTLPSNSTTTTLGDAILDLFDRNAVGESLVVTPAITRCHSQSNVNQLAWRKLVAASACYAKNNCPISLSMIVPSSINTVAKWQMTPATQTQRLVYQQLTTTEPVATQIPIVIKDDTGKIVASGATASFNAPDVQAKLRELLAFDGIHVSIQYDSALDSASSPTALRVVQWTIEYEYWVGLLPRFIESTATSGSTSTWVLATIPTVTPDTGSTEVEYTLEMHSAIAWNSTNSNGTWFNNNSTTTFVELTPP